MAPTTTQFYSITSQSRIRITIDQSAQNLTTNVSAVRVRGWLYNDGPNSVFNANALVDRIITGEQTYHPAAFGFNVGPGSTFLFIDHTFNVTHDPVTGMKGVDFTVQCGDTGTPEFDGPVSVGAHLDLTRIPRAPAAPGPPVFTNIRSTSLTVTWPACPDNHGSAVTVYRLRRWDETHHTHVDSDANNLTRNVTGLKAGATYIFEVFCKNAVGWSPLSDDRLVDLSGGMRVRIGGQWRTSEVYIREHTKGWVECQVYVRIGGVWKLVS